MNKPIEDKQFPHWMDILQSKQGIPAQLHPKVDAVMQRFHLPFWPTKEFLKKDNQWSEKEIKSGLNRVYRLILKQNTDIPNGLIDGIALIPEVESVHKGSIVSTPIEKPAFSQSMRRRDRVPPHYQLKEARMYTEGHPDVLVAILDTGIDLDHKELRHALVEGFDFVDIINGAKDFIGDYLGYDPEPDDEVGHGTHVAGIIAGRGLNMPMGIVPRCKIMPIRVLGTLKLGDQVVGAGLLDNINAGIKYAVDQGAKVINMSLGIKHDGGGLPHQDVINYAKAHDATIIAASGNDGTNQLYYPGANEYVIAVGAVDDRKLVAPFSTYGSHISFVAPGTNIYSSFINDKYGFASGTSQAAPFVSGLVAMLHAYAHKKRYRLTDRKIKLILQHTSDKLDKRIKHIKAGYGSINFLDALKFLDFKLN